ncbi:pilus assembly protein [Brevundimonas intermedia]|uniref:Pilus assembly protein n=1 Tax=Brevundimonas intermedia TaxID=74315 RepID=A0A4Y9RS74_9CAUL|nr:ubiquitin-activating E1 FCCH domain-containing protein [Brevundimonas intermedia]TFW11742.1 pilus assembly protein [Brevundimonas intermedia]
MVQGLRGLAARLSSDRGGNVVMIFALVMPALIMITLGGIDISRITTIKARVQDALDAAALAAARSPYTTPEELKGVALIALEANLRNSAAEYVDSDLSIVLTDEQVVVADLRVQVKTLVANVILPPYGKILDDTLPVSVHSEVNRSSKNVEVALVLDITGSMKGAPLTSLKAAAKKLVSIVVQDAQEPYSSRVALIPYSVGVNVGTYAEKVRGPLQGPTAISAADWADASKSISQISSGNITSSNHGLKVNDYVWISGVNNASQGLNDKVHRVESINGNKFRLAGYSGGGANGSFRRCWTATCDIVVTSTAHTLSTGDFVTISGVQGMTTLNTGRNNLYFQITRISADQFSVSLSGPGQSQYRSGTGTVQCGYDGCGQRYFINRYNMIRTLSSSNCVSERLWTTMERGHLIPTDIKPDKDNWVGRNYPTSGNRCPSNEITPLTDQVETGNGISGLNDLIDSYEAVGSTAGQIGIEWGWYAVSPKFKSFWPSESAANDYDPSKTLKAVVLMTDGEFNNPYCQGVISRGAPTDGSAGDANYQIGCNAPNGNPFTQAVALCDQMKKDDIIIYTVGFNLSSSKGGSGIDTAREVMESCATTTADHFFTPSSPSDLEDAFADIGRAITRLRISR